MTAESVNITCEKLKQTEKSAIKWEQNNTVLFNAEKIKIIMFTKKKIYTLKRWIQIIRIKVREHEVSFK